MARTLESLSRLYPLAGGWEISHVVEEPFEIEGECFSLLGMQARHESLPPATASAADVRDGALARCYFELLERTAIVDLAFGDESGTTPLLDEAGCARGRIATQELFPTGPSPRQRYSLSNGVACHETWSQACEAALLELVERDRVLRSWYGIGAAPRLLDVVPEPLEPFSSRYLISSCLLDGVSRGEEPIEVAGVFLFPRSPQLPFAAGFAAGRSEVDALERAARETIQRVGFLWGEDISEVAPSFETTPEYHLDYFLYPPHQEQVRSWLESRVAEPSGSSAPEPRTSEVSYADLTPSHLRGRLSVARAVGGGHLALVFGEGHPSLSSDPVERPVHPVA